ncbi:MAG: diguanylate cyclase [Ruminococcaceae bacterium]|nr:diguanylate cyclase [Oscillospiraceae bacterium]
MSAKETKELTLLGCVYAALLVAMAAYLLSLSATRDTNMTDFSASWRVNGETLADAVELSAGDYGGSIVLEKELPDTLAYNDRLCLTVSNARFTVFIDGVEAYSYGLPENLTGKGYGRAYHSINLSPEQAGKTVRIELVSVFDNHKGGRIYKPQIGAPGAYLYELAGRHLASIFCSVGTMFLGVVTLLLLPFVSRIRRLLLPLGVTALIAGLWMTNDTGVLMLLTGNVTASRVLDHTLLHLVDFPLALLISESTYEKKMRGVRLVFAFTVLDISAYLLLRFGFGVDMAWLTPIMAVYHAASFAVIAWMLVDDRRYCREHRIKRDMKLLYVGVACMLGSMLLDLGIYFAGVRSTLGHGFCSRAGFVMFASLLVLQLVRWWMRERTAIDRDRFINRVLQYAVSAGDPETSIRTMLQYVGTELHAKRTYIFEGRENQSGGSWHGTYEWFADGMEPRAPELLDLPYDGLIDELYKVFQRDNRLIIPSREECREMNPILYQVLTANHVERMAVGPLEANGELIGLLGVDDAPKEYLPEIAEIIRIISYIFAQLVLNREDQKKLVRYSYYDALTGCRNRRALEKFEKETLDTARPYGFVMCDINGLKQTNDTLGHEAGDAMILDVSACLAEVFGVENVYRTGGDEFAAYAVCDAAAAFDEDVERLRAQIAQKGHSAALGAVFCAQGEPDYNKAKAKADALMYEDKRKYYEAHGDRRKR